MNNLLHTYVCSFTYINICICSYVAHIDGDATISILCQIFFLAFS